MLTSAPGRCSGSRPGPNSRRSRAGRRPRSRGFTLIEIMVVLMIIGLFIGLSSAITRPDEGALLRLETERLAQLLDLAATESRLTGKRIAWTAEAGGYRFWRFGNDSGWLEIRDVDTLRPRPLPGGMRITGLTLENGPADAMRIEFTSSAPPPSFVVALGFGGARSAVSGSPIGEIRIIDDQEQSNVAPLSR